MDGSLTALVYRLGVPEKLPREGWELRGQFETGITSNFVSPHDPLNPGPRTDVDGQRHAVFIDRVEFDGWFNSMFADPTRQAEQLDTNPHRGGKKKGDGSYKNVDAPLQREMKLLIQQGKATSVRAAARLVLAMLMGPEPKRARLIGSQKVITNHSETLRKTRKRSFDRPPEMRPHSSMTGFARQ